MWLFSSSVGRKFIMAVTGACLVLFVTFHCAMNAVAICWPTAYNDICEFLGANWYALVASIGLAALFIIHIIYACWLTVLNRKARGADRYLVSKRPKTVEWSSQNMLVLGIFVLAFLVVHLIQFWAKMQLQEIRGVETAFPAAAGTIYIQEAFSLIYTPIVYIIGFIALWFHMNHGFWSMFQSIGWDSTVWIPRLKKVACWWTTIVIGLFIAQAIVFTVKAHEGYYKTNAELREQYKDMLAPMFEKAFGPSAPQQLQAMSYDQVKELIKGNLQQMNDPQVKEQYKNNPDFINQLETFTTAGELIDYLEGTSGNELNIQAPQIPVPAPQNNPTPNN